jgi:hypothetical protein
MTEAEVRGRTRNSAVRKAQTDFTVFVDVISGDGKNCSNDDTVAIGVFQFALNPFRQLCGATGHFSLSSPLQSKMPG